MQPPLPCMTKVWHNDTYDKISPDRQQLKVTGKTVVVIGAGSGIGRETAIAFSAAGAGRLHLLGRTASALEDTASAVDSGTQSTVHSVDITVEREVQEAAKKIQQWDILVFSAGYCSTPSSLSTAELSEWGRSYETNIKGTLHVLQAFTPTASAKGAKLIILTTGTTTLPAAQLPGLSAYITAKLAQTKLVEFFAAENSHIFAATVHPGMVDTSIFRKSGAKAEQLPMDQAKLPAHFILWMCSDEAAFLRGRSVWANWDVTELVSQAESIQNGQRLTAVIDGWPFTPS